MELSWMFGDSIWILKEATFNFLDILSRHLFSELLGGGGTYTQNS
jgi:hypothetical protein